MGTEQNEWDKWNAITPPPRKYSIPSVESRIASYSDDRRQRLSAVAERVPFIGPETGLLIYPGLILIGGISGKGKSTLLANLLAGFVKANPNKKAVVITNEESLSAIYDRIACILEEKSFHRFYTGELKQSDLDQLAERVESLIRTNVEVVDSKDYDMTCMEDVQAVFQYAVESKAGLAALDYYQTITHSKEHPEMEAFAVLKRMGGWLKTFVKNIPNPIITLVQLRQGTPGEGFKERVENDRQIFNHAHQCIEIQPNFETRETKARVVKSRYGADDINEVTLQYKDGRFVVEGDI